MIELEFHRGPAMPATPALHFASRRAMVPPRAPAYEAIWATTQDEVRAAQRLRHRVFVEEMGARPAPLVGAPAGHEIDVFDEFCEHLLVRTGTGEVVGTCRVLTPAAARRAGSFYGDTEFDLTRLRPLRARMVELGRSCVHPAHRGGAVVVALWIALAQFMERNSMDVALGSANLSMRDGGHCAASLWARLQPAHLAPIDCRVRPRVALPVDDLERGLPVAVPAPVHAWLRLGAKLLGAPAWDPGFNTADLPLLARLADLPERHRRRLSPSA